MCSTGEPWAVPLFPSVVLKKSLTVRKIDPRSNALCRNWILSHHSNAGSCPKCVGWSDPVHLVEMYPHTHVGQHHSAREYSCRTLSCIGRDPFCPRHSTQLSKFVSFRCSARAAKSNPLPSDLARARSGAVCYLRWTAFLRPLRTGIEYHLHWGTGEPSRHCPTSAKSIRRERQFGVNSNFRVCDC